jgi:hypothetical protein
MSTTGDAGRLALMFTRAHPNVPESSLVEASASASTDCSALQT